MQSNIVASPADNSNLQVVPDERAEDIAAVLPNDEDGLVECIFTLFPDAAGDVASLFESILNQVIP